MAATEMKAPEMILANAAVVSMTTRFLGAVFAYGCVSEEPMRAIACASSDGASVGAVSATKNSQG